jgi:hypothetical protein
LFFIFIHVRVRWGDYGDMWGRRGRSKIESLSTNVKG